MAASRGDDIYKKCFLLKGELQYRLDINHDKGRFSVQSVQSVNQSNPNIVVFEILALGNESFPQNVLQTIKDFFTGKNYDIVSCCANLRSAGTLLTTSVVSKDDNNNNEENTMQLNGDKSFIGYGTSNFSLFDPLNIIILGILGILIVYLTTQFINAKGGRS
jgi:hypothetical protein